MSLLDHTIPRRGVATDSEPPHLTDDRHIVLSTQIGKRVIKIPTKTGFFVGVIVALLIVIIILIIFN